MSSSLLFDVLLRHRLLRQPHGFEGFGSLLEPTKASDLPVLDRVDESAPRLHFALVAPPSVRSIRTTTSEPASSAIKF
jgi:hypothetical protein